MLGFVFFLFFVNNHRGTKSLEMCFAITGLDAKGSRPAGQSHHETKESNK